MRWLSCIMLLVIYTAVAFADPADFWIVRDVPVVTVVSTVPILPEHNPQPVYPCGTP